MNIISKQERRRKQWRDSKHRCRNWYFNGKGKLLSIDEKDREVERSRIINAAARQKRTETDWIEVRKKHQIYKKKKLEEESSNQRFWRLVKWRQQRHIIIMRC